MTAELTTSDAGIQIQRTFDAQPERVFAALTTPDEFSRWFGGFGTNVPVERVALDPRPGGRWSAVMELSEPVEMEMPWAGRYLEVVPGRTLVFTMEDNTDAASGHEETVCVHLRPEGDGSALIFEQAGGNLTAEQYAQAGAGWLGFLDSLAEVVDIG